MKSAAEALLLWHPLDLLILQKGLKPQGQNEISETLDWYHGTSKDMSWSTTINDWRNVVENHMGDFLWNIIHHFSTVSWILRSQTLCFPGQCKELHGSYTSGQFQSIRTYHHNPPISSVIITSCNRSAIPGNPADVSFGPGLTLQSSHTCANRGKSSIPSSQSTPQNMVNFFIIFASTDKTQT